METLLQRKCLALTGMETLPRRIYAGRKYPNIYTLSISTDKNQSTKVHSVYTFQHKENNYKVITERDIILQVHYITARYKSKIYNMYSAKDTHELRGNPAS